MIFLKRIITLASVLLAFIYARAASDMHIVGTMNNWTVSDEYKMTETVEGAEWTFDFGQAELAGQHFMIKQSAVIGVYLGACNTVGTLDDGLITLQPNGYDIMLSPKYKSATNVKVILKKNSLIYSSTLTVTGNFTKDESYEAPTPASATEPSGTLPVLYLTTDSSKSVIDKPLTHDVATAGTCYIDSKGIDGQENLGDKDNQYAVTVQGRGNLTWKGFAKKPYKLKFNSSTSPLGLSAGKKFALMAGADDIYSQLRNVVGYEISRRMNMPWTPAQCPVEVVWNGEYLGLYMISETIGIGKNRVNITQQADNETEAHAITGGWLVEIDNFETTPQVVLPDAGNWWPLRITGSSPEVWSAEQEAYVKDQWQHIYDAVSTSDWEATAKYIDIDAAARFYIIQEITENREAYNGSCNLYKDIDPEGGTSKWMFGPVWDFGCTMSSLNNGKPQYIWEDYAFNAHIIDNLHNDPDFMESVKRQWRSFMENNYDGLTTVIHNTITATAQAAKNDAARWPQYDHSDVASAEAAYVTRLQERIEWLTQQWGGPSGIENIEREETNDTHSQAANNNSAYYTLQGIRVSKPHNGTLYIHNGKKLVWQRD